MSTVTSYGGYPLDHYVYVPKDRVEKQNIKDGFKYDVPGVKFKIREAGRDWLVTAQTYFLITSDDGNTEWEATQGRP
ncbi:hypothetical protein ACO1O0_008420 [Amphichorda felina]